MKKLQKKCSVAAFIDILGYKELIQNESADKEIELFNELKTTIDFALISTVETIKVMLNYLDNKLDVTEKISSKLNVKQFSDNIYFSFDYDENDDEELGFGIYIISTISLVYQKSMLGKGYFVRGGIAHGLNMVDKNFIFSNALIDAVQTEKDTIYPRITLHPKLKEQFLKLNNSQLTELIMPMYVEDWAGHIFINPFNQISNNQKTIEMLSQEQLDEIETSLTKLHKRMINKLNNEFSYLLNDKEFNSISRAHISKKIKKYKFRTQSIYEKYLWLRNFLNWVENKQSDLTFRNL